jgi:hypothetical protein
MNIQEFLSTLHGNAELPLAIVLPDGSPIPAHFHITEVGHVTRRFIDCGGTRRVQESCLLQTWVHDDIEHRLHAGKLAEIFVHAGDILPHPGLPVEVEHELGAVSQFTVESATARGGKLVVALGTKHTDCLARGVCLPDTCAPKPVQPAPAQSSCCDPKSGCC